MFMSLIVAGIIIVIITSIVIHVMIVTNDGVNSMTIGVPADSPCCRCGLRLDI